ncbi:inhibitor of growth protein 1 homolog [Anastrepha ludens]|uniref:inhibitor of growth protein 1 homolog n=1 Tax=Anastrepha ludens TaxID=28586 RepID=UPI0023B0A458|nr:inhibitor of growth protein 1 homolog [Anastrepha ludens]XP_053948798.1 inhibitor of growth protein 1 homolog [Anastrepha ludens]XP_053948799.1 inhibitor of growth protein 1 homolog [Anastrepha ludens]XP_053948800.1 inhibitor of growth protein 1 homolog [Anastrepha ludens]XP_053948801.1 inhibitor of growth protein 1 homolog [Anastrepha ludens]
MPDLSQDVFEIQNPISSTPLSTRSSSSNSVVSQTAANGSWNMNGSGGDGSGGSGGGGGGSVSTLSVPGQQQEVLPHNGAHGEMPHQGYKRELDHR